MNEAEARKAAIALWSTLDVGVGTRKGLSLGSGVLKEAGQAAADIKVKDGTRRSPSGNALDLSAPSFWHAACALMLHYCVSRVDRRPYTTDAEDVTEGFFGRHPVFRGQTRPWQVLPTAWRYDGNAALGIETLRQVVMSYMGPDDAVELDLYGRMENETSALCLGQHYGIATNLVDFTFDPRVALLFAIGPSESEATLGSGDCGVVDFIGFKIAVVLAKHAADTVESKGGEGALPRVVLPGFPPVGAPRLFRQCGLFFDFGDAREGELEFPIAHWLMQNCCRMVFPRTYPEAEEYQELKQICDFLLPNDPFFKELTEKIRSARFDERDPQEMVASIRGSMRNNPPWRIQESGKGFIYTAQEFVAVAQAVEGYIRTAGLIEMNREAHLDPVVVLKLLDFGFDALLAIPSVRNLIRGTGSDVGAEQSFKFIGDLIEEALAALRTMEPSRNA